MHLSFVRCGINKNARSKREQVMSSQPIIGDQADGTGEQRKGSIVPLDLPEREIMSQSLQADGSIEVHVRAIKEREACPGCGKICVKIHDIRERVKQDMAMGNHHVRLIFSKRRFPCLACKRTFPQTDSCCGRYTRTTKRLRDALALQAQKRPIAHVAEEAGVGPRFVQECLEGSVQDLLVKQGRTLEETSQLPTPRYLGIDEFARRKGHRSETILGDLVNRTVLEISEGRTLEELQKLLERLSTPDAVEAVSMDRSASFRPAVQLCLPKAQIVVDHFHVIQHVMKAFKKSVSSWAHNKEGKPLLQGKQYLFLTAKEDLTAEHARDRGTIGEALPVLEAAWHLKEA